MKFVFALAPNQAAKRGVINSERPPNVLVSQVYRKVIDDLTYTPDYFLLDSGAFTAWSAGKSVDINEYARYSSALMRRIPHTWVINLDVIPGEKGRTATPTEIAQGMRKSIMNADFLRSRDLPVVEVFHQNEPLSFLDELIARRPNERAVVGISPRNDVSIKQRTLWLKSVLGYVVKKHGVKHMPRFHGLAVTAPQMLRAFPFYSTDSSTWAVAYMFGGEVGPRGKRISPTDTKRFSLPHSKNPVAQDFLCRHAIRNLIGLGNEITRLWEVRGVTFRD